MPSPKNIERIEPISGSEKSRLQPTSADEAEGAQKAKFGEAFEKADPSKVERRQVAEFQPPPIDIPSHSGKESIMELAKRATQEVPKVAPNPSDVLTQASQLRQQLQSAQSKLVQAQQQQVQLPKNVVTQLSNQIQHVDRGLQEVTKVTKTVEVGASKTVETTKPPLVRFLSYLTENDKRLSNFMDEIGGLKIGKQKLTPDVLIALQIKLGFISQQLEFFTTTLSKALESTKTVMNVQI